TPNTAASTFATAPVTPSAPPMPATQSRPKTSHTTIKCRYRTNLNAHIQSLRQVVPALHAAAIKAGEPYPGMPSFPSTLTIPKLLSFFQAGNASDPEDHIDARGFVDSLKIARKCSKTNLLGKAVKYI
ncbi:hypothetical protein B0H16DRAFT_1251508, partial [Mycena metata]